LQKERLEEGYEKENQKKLEASGSFGKKYIKYKRLRSNHQRRKST
jgi:hypothetical protein